MKLINYILLGTIFNKYFYSLNSFYSYSAYVLKMKNSSIYMKKKDSHFSFQPKTKNQELYLSYLRNPNIKILGAIGPAGTGKTFLACQEAITLLKFNLINKIILTRPVVPVEEDIGFLPGNLVKKMDPWTRPILDVFEEKYSKQEVDNLIKNNIIEISPLAYMRGRTFKDAFIIADEMQNSSPNQMLMLTTRIGENSKMVITGDLKQTDKPLKSGLSDFTNKFYNFKNKMLYSYKSNDTISNPYEFFNEQIGIQIVELTQSDIQRSAVVSRVLEMYDTDETNINNSKYIKYQLLQSENKNSNYTSKSRKISDSDAALIPKYLYKEI
jgi:phosphate starvation-inducible PhoH-like protein